MKYRGTPTKINYTIDVGHFSHLDIANFSAFGIATDFGLFSVMFAVAARFICGHLLELTVLAIPPTHSNKYQIDNQSDNDPEDVFHNVGLIDTHGEGSKSVLGLKL